MMMINGISPSFSGVNKSSEIRKTKTKTQTASENSTKKPSPYDIRRTSIYAKNCQTNAFTEVENYGNKSEKKYAKEVLLSVPEPKKPVKPKKNKFVKPAIGAVIISASFLAGGKAATAPKDPKGLKIDMNKTPYTISELAEIYGSNTDFIYEYNELNSLEDLENLQSIYIPARYDYLESEIDKIYKKLDSKFISKTEREEYQKQILAMKEKQKCQEEVADIYCDNKFVYFKLKTPKKNPQLRGKYGQTGINTETFKALFDIKDNYIKEYNPDALHTDDIIIEYDNHNIPNASYYDYTSSAIQYGSLIKVPKAAIDTKNIKIEQ